MRITCFSDSHGVVNDLDVDTDVVICAGDFCNSGELNDVIAFNRWFSKLPCKHKILIAGNHDVCFEKEPALARSLLGKDVVYLQDEGIDIDGIKFYGSPWQLPFMDWAFNLPEDDLFRKFERIPAGVDVLITHSPPYGILDGIPSKKNLGSTALLNKVRAIKPRHHIFGHVHHGYGELKDRTDNITFHNVSLLDEGYKFVNRPIVIEIE